MFESIGLKNFKAYESVDSVRLAPLTLIYGKNSSGKSAIAQAIMQALQTGSLVYKTPTFDIGNFEQVVFGQDSNKEVTIKSTIALRDDEHGKGIPGFIRTGRLFARFNNSHTTFWQLTSPIETTKIFDQHGLKEIIIGVKTRPLFYENNTKRGRHSNKRQGLTADELISKSKSPLKHSEKRPADEDERE